MFPYFILKVFITKARLDHNEATFSQHFNMITFDNDNAIYSITF